MRFYKWCCYFAIAFFSVGALSADTGVKGIKGADDRILVNGADRPWQAVGRINLAGRGYCTGVLVSPKYVLTAAHCVWNKHTSKPVPARYMYFMAGYHKESYVAVSQIQQVHLIPKFSTSHQISLKTAEKDLALLALKTPIYQVKPIQYIQLSAIELSDLAKVTNIVQAGFSRDRPFILTVDKQCKLSIKVRGKELVAHECDAVRGDSGSPLMIQTNSGLKLVAIHSSNRHPKNHDAIGIAVPLANMKRIPVSGIL